MQSGLRKELEYYITHQDELVEKYNGKFIVIKNCEVIGAYNTALEAVETTKQKHSLGTFIVQKCEPGEEGYTQTYHSRVSFGKKQYEGKRIDGSRAMIPWKILIPLIKRKF